MNNMGAATITSAYLSGVLALSACSTGENASGEDPKTFGVTMQTLSLGSSLGVPVYSGSTCGLNNGVTPQCTSSTASDMSFGWTAPTQGVYTFTATGTNFDTVLVIGPYNNPSSQLACRNNVNGPGSESVTLSLSAGQQLLITVDGYASLCGNYSLDIIKNCLTSCNTDCQIGYCSAQGQCLTSPKPAGAECDDHKQCTYGDACNGAGQCVATASPAGTPCDDGDSCTSGDACNGRGRCFGSTNTCSEDRCAAFGDYEYCGSEPPPIPLPAYFCCIWGTNCLTCL